MKLYVRLMFTSDGMIPLDVIKKMKDGGFEPVVGDYDFACDFNGPTEYSESIKRLHSLLTGTGVIYTLSTRKD